MEILAVLAEGAVNATFVESEVDGLSDQPPESLQHLLHWL